MTDHEEIPENETAAEPNDEAVIVVHGLWMPGWETRWLRHRLDAAGYRTYVFVYPTVGAGLRENADGLADYIAKVPGRRVHLVGHSLGGVLIVKLLERRDVPRVGRVVCLGSPLTGTQAGRRLRANRFGRRILGRCIADLLDGGGCEHWDGRTELGVIAGDLPLGFGRLLGGLPQPSDGTVAVEETCLPGATEHAVLHCSHMSMLWSASVAEHVLRFLARGTFASEVSDDLGAPDAPA